MMTMTLLPLLTLLTLAPYEEAQPSVDGALVRACAELDAKLRERQRVLADALVASARALVRYDDAVKRPLPQRPTASQVRTAGDEVLAAHEERERAERHLQQARAVLASMQAYVTEERQKLHCPTTTPRG